MNSVCSQSWKFWADKVYYGSAAEPIVNNINYEGPEGIFSFKQLTLMTFKEFGLDALVATSKDHLFHLGKSKIIKSAYSNSFINTYKDSDFIIRMESKRLNEEIADTLFYKINYLVTDEFFQKVTSMSPHDVSCIIVDKLFDACWKYDDQNRPQDLPMLGWLGSIHGNTLEDHIKKKTEAALIQATLEAKNG